MSNKTIYEYQFFSEKIATRLTLHSLVTHFLGKDGVSEKRFKVSSEAKIIKIKTDIDLDVSSGFNLKLFNERGEPFTITLVKKSDIEAKKYNNGDSVTIAGLIEYAVNITNGKKKCPFFLGRFESVELREKFKQHIESTLGVSVKNMENLFFDRVPSEILSDKIQLNNLVSITLPVTVVDCEKFNTIEFQSFFQKKSYGLGSLSVL